MFETAKKYLTMLKNIELTKKDKKWFIYMLQFLLISFVILVINH